MKPTLPCSADEFRHLFVTQLEQMLTSDELGVFVLVLANATSNHAVLENLELPLQKKFEYFRHHLSESSIEVMSSFAEDDVMVFKKLMAIGFKQLSITQTRQAGEWALQFNQLRSFRPVRNSARNISHLFQSFDENGFHFNKPFLKHEILWQGKVSSINLRLLYNKFPFADYQTLLVLQPQHSRPQFLQQAHCLELQQVINHLSEVKGLGLGYNSLGAYASINHQHWHSFISDHPYPVESRQWHHNEGDRDYPLPIQCFDSMIDAWPLIDHWQQQNNAFNLLVRADKTYAISRKLQGGYQHEDWTSGFAWSETMGNFVTSNLQNFNQLTGQKIIAEMSKLKLD